MNKAELITDLETNKSKREVVQMGLGTFDLGMGHQICRQTLRGWQDLPHHLTAWYHQKEELVLAFQILSTIMDYLCNENKRTGVAALALTQQAM